AEHQAEGEPVGDPPAAQVLRRRYCEQRQRRRGHQDRVRAHAGVLMPAAAGDYIELLSDVQRASTLSPTDEISAMAPTMISPAISAYSITSPPCSSLRSFFNVFMISPS